MTCENCGAPMLLDRDRNLMVCQYCQTEAVPPMDEDGVQIVGETDKVCPGCGSKLSNGLMETQSLLYCAQCHGMLIEMEQLQPLVEHLRAVRDRPAAFVGAPQNDAKNLHCPLCNGAMDDHPYGGPGNVIVDSCEQCSVIWLDRGELRRIVVAPDPRPVYSDYEPIGESDHS
jgi:Zn-finger nucleic acid-binding protein